MKTELKVGDKVICDHKAYRVRGVKQNLAEITRIESVDSLKCIGNAPPPRLIADMTDEEWKARGFKYWSKPYRKWSTIIGKSGIECSLYLNEIHLNLAHFYNIRYIHQLDKLIEFLREVE